MSDRELRPPPLTPPAPEPAEPTCALEQASTCQLTCTLARRLLRMSALAVTFLVFYAFAPVLPWAHAHWKPGVHNRYHAIVGAWCGRDSLARICPRGWEAIRVAKCEAGRSMSPHARNGQFLGMFQMGWWARSRFGHGVDPWSQARAAHRYWLVSGWAPWECRP